MNEYERVREEIVDKFQNLWTVQTYGEKLELARQLLAIQCLCIKADDQSLPDNEFWHKDPKEFEAYCAGRNDMVNDNFVRVIPPPEGKK